MMEVPTHAVDDPVMAGAAITVATAVAKQPEPVV